MPAAAIERIINENMTWLADTDATKLMMSLLIMRHYEAEYRLTPSELTRQLFLKAYKQFTDTFDTVDGTPEMKDAPGAASQTLRRHVREMDRGFRPRLSIARLDRHRQPKHVAARRRHHCLGQSAEPPRIAALTASQGRTRSSIIAVGIAMVAIGLGLSWLIGRSITGPLNGLAEA